jgi:hypothetical protein
MNTQEKFIGQLGRRAASNELELVIDYEFANRGVFRFQRPGTFQTYLTIPFEFNVGRLGLGWSTNRNALDVFPSRPNPRSASFENDDLQDAIHTLITFAKQQRQAADK